MCQNYSNTKIYVWTLLKVMGGAPIGAGGHDPRLLEAKENRGNTVWE